MGEAESLENVGYLQDIISYVFDEKKIVTYKWISNILAIHVNRAKQLLYTFIKHISEERLKELKVIYLVGGILPNDGGCRLQLVSEEDLKTIKAQFKVITSEHIYSISLTYCLSDLHNLCSVDGVKDSKVGSHGALRCTRGVARTAQEVTSKRQEAYKAVDDEKKWPTVQSKKQEKESSAGGNDKKSSKTANISAMFSTQNSKKKAENGSMSKKPEEMQKEENASSPEKKTAVTKKSPKDGQPPANRLAAMFSAQNAKPKNVKREMQEESNAKCEKHISENEARVSPNNSKSDQRNEKKESVSKNVQEKPSKNKGSKTENKKSKPKKRKASGNTEDKNKKRKRIVIMDDSDSSSDDMFGSDNEGDENSHSRTALVNDEETEEPTEVATPEKPEPQEETNDHRGRKRCLVDKTYEDEEGYIVTKKVYEFVSCSESDHEGEKENEKSTKSKIKEKQIESTSKSMKSSKKSEKKNTQNSPPEKKKQATLMNFFKRS